MDLLPALKQFQKMEHGHVSKVGVLATAAIASAHQLNEATSNVSPAKLAEPLSARSSKCIADVTNFI